MLRKMRRALAAAAQIRARIGPRGPVVLLYHRVAEPEHDPFRLCVSPRNFAEQLDVLRGLGDVVSLDRLLNGRGAARREVAITFDDGYVDNLTAAAPLLLGAAAPATVFVATGFIGREFWWDRLERLIFSSRQSAGAAPLFSSSAERGRAEPPDPLVLEIGGHVHTLHPNRLAAQLHSKLAAAAATAGVSAGTAAVYHRAHALLKDADAGQRDAAIDRLEASLDPAPRDASGRPRAMNADEIALLSGAGLIDLGAHSVTHGRLAGLDDAVQRSEIAESRDALERIVGASVTTFAYPFGQRGDYDARTIRLLRDERFACACAAFPGSLHGRTDPMQVPRIWIEDWDGEEFARRVAPWLPGRS